MRSQDFDEFRALLDQLSMVWTGFAAKDDLAKAYWHSLHDVALPEFTRNVERILRTATGKQPFPKPAELRNEAPREQTPAGEATFQSGEQRAIRNLDELKREDEAAWRREVRMRYLDRRIATEWEGSPIYAQALHEWHQLRRHP